MKSQCSEFDTATSGEKDFNFLQKLVTDIKTADKFLVFIRLFCQSTIRIAVKGEHKNH